MYDYGFRLGITGQGQGAWNRDSSGGIEGAVSVGVCVVYCCQHTMLYIYGVAYPTWDVALR